MNIIINENYITDFCDLLVSLPMFSNLNNTENLKNVFTEILKDIYLDIPEELINFLKSNPSKKFLTLYFLQMGIDEVTTKTIPTDFKAKLIYILYQLFEVRGTVQVYKYFAEIMEDITGPMNFYNVVVEQTEDFINEKFTTPKINKIEYYKEGSEIAPEDSYRPINEYVAEGYTEFKAKVTISFDYKKFKKITTVTINTKPWARIKITLSPTDYEISKNNFTEKVIYIEPLFLSGKLEEDLSIFDSQTHGVKSFKYKLKPIYIMNDKNIITEIDDDFLTQKYFMKLEQYIQRNAKTSKRNIFPVHTNVLYIQYTTGDDLYDTKKILPDLIRMYGMTSLQNEKFYMKIGTYAGRIPLNDYMDILSYIKLQEIKFKNPGWEFNGEIKKFDPIQNKNIPIDIYFSYFQYPLNILPEIETLLYEYKIMLIDTKDVYVYDKYQNNILKRISPYDQFHSFKKKFQKLLSLQENIKLNNIFNSTEFREKLAGNKPNTITETKLLLIELINKVYENDIYNKTILLEELDFIQIEWGLEDTEVNTYINLLMNYSLKNYELYKNNITIKYPRLIQEIDKLAEKALEIDPETNEALGPKIYFYTFLELYKQAEPDIIKKNDYNKYFFRDTYMRLLIGGTFKEEFFDPIVNLFNNYFFNVNQSYYNSDTIILKINDKLNFIPMESKNKYQIDTLKFDKTEQISKEYTNTTKQINSQIAITDKQIVTVIQYPE